MKTLMPRNLFYRNVKFAILTNQSDLNIAELAINALLNLIIIVFGLEVVLVN